MRRAILWLDSHWGDIGVVVLIACFVGLLLAFLGGVEAAIRTNTKPTGPEFFRGVWHVTLGGGVLFGIGWAVRQGYLSAVSWAKSPPKVKSPKSYAQALLDCKLAAPAPDPFLEAARREVEQIAPEADQ